MECGVRGLGFKTPGLILTSRTETSSLSRVVRDGWDPCSQLLSGWKKSLLQWSHRLCRWTATTVQKTTQNQKNKKDPNGPYLLPTLQFTLQCMWNAQKCITCIQTFLISILGSWKHTTAFHKSSDENQHQGLKHHRQYWCYGNQSVVGNRGGQWTLWNRGDIGLSPASREITQTNKPPKHYTETGGPEHQQFS